MTLLFNPIVLSKIIISYIFDVNRIWKMDEKELHHYQDKALRRVVKYAYNVSLYHDKYRKAGIYPDEIKGINDIKKLPFVSKNDLRNYFPHGIIHKNVDKKNLYLMSTSGSTGKPVFVYSDTFSAVKRLIALVRELKAYNGNWRKSKIVLIIDLDPNSVERIVFVESIKPFFKNFFSLDNITYLSIHHKSEILIEKLNKLLPEFLGSDPNLLFKLALLKNEGLGENIQPKYVISSGASLDDYTKEYVEKAFKTKVLDVYGTTEAGSLAFECIKGNYHIQSDFAFLEILDEKNNQVDSEQTGKLVVTKLYNGGTPIIRYTGTEDFLTPIDARCNCGIKTNLIKKIEGRSVDMINLPSGKIISPLTITGIPAEIMDEKNTYKIEQFQIIQHKYDEMEVKIIIDEKLRNSGTSVQELKKDLKDKFSKKIGNDIKFFINEVDEIKRDKDTKNLKVFFSKINK